MSLPLSPTNGQIAVINGINHVYNSIKGAWIRVAGTVTSTSVLSITSSTQSVSTTTGALTVAGGVGVGGNIYFGGSLYQNGVLFTGGGASSTSTTSTFIILNTTTGTSTTTGALVVSGGVGVGGNVNIGGTVTGGGIRSTSSSSAPANPTVGDIWYITGTDAIARYTSDGVTSAWLDITSPTVGSSVSGSSGGLTAAKAYTLNLLFGG
jgi:hypothetical protein